MVSVIPPSPRRQRLEKALGKKQFTPHYHPICLCLNETDIFVSKFLKAVVTEDMKDIQPDTLCPHNHYELGRSPLQKSVDVLK